VSALILCNTRASADTEEVRSNRLKSAEEVLQRGTGQFFDSMLPKLLGESTRRNRPDLVAAARKTFRGSAAGVAAVQEGMAQRPDSTSILKSVNVPTLLVAGAEDASIPLSEMEFLHQQISGSELRVIPEAGHYSVFEKPEESMRIIRKFLDSLR
jgi:pimeloyl-ACP methyl ester carboxylesterase